MLKRQQPCDAGYGGMLVDPWIATPLDVKKRGLYMDPRGPVTQLFVLVSVVDKARRQIGLFLVILLTVSAVVIALIIYTMTMEKLKQLATLKLIGAPDRTIVALIIQQALILGASGWGIGLAIILLVKDYFPRRVVLEPSNAFALAAIIFIVCIAAAALGVRVALKVDPATALGS